MPTETLDLWQLVRGRPEIDPNDLAEAIVVQVESEDLCYRTKWLIHDALNALEEYWGSEEFHAWYDPLPLRDRLEEMRREEYERIGFPSLARRIMDKTDPEVIRQFFEHLGRFVRQETEIHIAESGALILSGYLSRKTDDLGIVGEVPEEIRNNHALMDQLTKDYGLILGHVQTHYFPKGWRDRVHAFGVYRRLTVSLVDVYDVFLSKLFSVRFKDIADLRVLNPQLEKDRLVQRFKDTCQDFLSAPRLREIAADNWQLLFGESLPS